MRFWLDTEFIEDGSTIDLISIGIVAEDGREYYAEVFDEEIPWDRCNQWVLDNVRPHLTGRSAQNHKWAIAGEIAQFVGGGEPEFWAFCGAYDWVVLNQLYGPMVEHPRNWPYYCNDVAQLAMHVNVNRRNLPRQSTQEHNALEDARWTRDSYLWLRDRVKEAFLR